MSTYKYKNMDDPKNLQAIKDAPDLGYKIDMMNKAYSALMEYRDNQIDPTFNTYFKVMPCATLEGQEVGRVDWNAFKETIEHGLIVTVPNVPDDELPENAKASRNRAVEIALSAARTVQHTINPETGRARGQG